LSNEHRVMLNHMADTWDRIATDMEKRMRQGFPRLV
jgi:hypothetical protein